MRTTAWLLLVAAATWTGCGSSDAPGANDGAVGIPAGTPSETRTAKPDPPIDLEILYEPAPAPGAPTRVVVGVTSKIDLLDCRLDARLPEGVTLAEGAASWRGSIARGRRHTHAFAVRVPDARRSELIVTATAELDGGTRIARAASVVIHPDAAPAKPAAPAGEIKTNSRGEKILELPAGEPR